MQFCWGLAASSLPSRCLVTLTCACWLWFCCSASVFSLCCPFVLSLSKVHIICERLQRGLWYCILPRGINIYPCQGHRQWGHLENQWWRGLRARLDFLWGQLAVVHFRAQPDMQKAPRSFFGVFQLLLLHPCCESAFCSLLTSSIPLLGLPTAMLLSVQRELMQLSPILSWLEFHIWHFYLPVSNL